MNNLLNTLNTLDNIRGHNFLSQEIIDNAVEIGNQEWKWNDTVILVKYFFPWNGWTWYITEIESDWIAFWLTDWNEREWGSVSLYELEQMVIRGLTVERDLYFGNKTIKDI